MISGEARGRRLLTPKGLRIRPTADRIKESLFNILTGLRGQFTGCRVLDVFAGTGNLGIEAISRGAALAVFVSLAVLSLKAALPDADVQAVLERMEPAEKDVHSLTFQFKQEADVTVTGEGNGPVNALFKALLKALIRFYPRLAEMRLEDYKVRVLPGTGSTDAKVRVLIESRDAHDRWGTVGVSFDIIEASWAALVDSINYKMYKAEKSNKEE